MLCASALALALGGVTSAGCIDNGGNKTYPRTDAATGVPGDAESDSPAPSDAATPSDTPASPDTAAPSDTASASVQVRSPVPLTVNLPPPSCATVPTR